MAVSIGERRSPSSISALELRHAMSHFASGVTIVTTLDGAGGPVGTTVSAVSSLSAEPALLLVCMAQRSATLDALLRRGGFTVNVLAAGQHALSSGFARPGTVASWDGVDHAPGPHGHPHLAGVLAALDCAVEEVVAGGDHQIVIGRVLGAQVADRPGDPLLHWRGTYAGVRPA